MKKIIIISILLLSIKSFACICEKLTLEQKFIQSNFIAKVKVKRIYKNLHKEKYYKADIEILDLYKGNIISSIYIYGNNKGQYESSCDIFIDVNEELVIYSIKNSQEKHVVGMCSGLLYLNKKTNSNTTNKRHQKEIKILENLKLNKVEITNDIRFTSEDFHPMRRENYGIKLKREFAIFELTFNEDLSVKCVKKIQGFRNKIDRNIKSFFKKSQWSSLNKNYKKNKIMKNTKTLVIIYYKVDEKNNIGYITNKF